MNIRALERQSIREFLVDSRQYLGGDTLDFGCGDQPYRDVVLEAGGKYHAHDQAFYPGSVVKESVGVDFPLAQPEWDAIICTQVIQYVTYPPALIRMLKSGLKTGGVLLMTGPTNWPIVEMEDLWRFTAEGVKKLFEEQEFLAAVGYRAAVEFKGEKWPLGWWAIGINEEGE